MTIDANHDISAGLSGGDSVHVSLVFISLTGLVLLYFVHKYRLAGVILAAVGALASYVIYLGVWVP